MRKILITVLLTVFLFPTVTTTGFAQSIDLSVIDNFKNENINVTDFTVDDILALEPYVHVEDGFFIFNEKEAIEDGVDYELIKGQQEYFNFLNQQVENNVISVSKDLTIENLSVSNQYQGNRSIELNKTCYGRSVAAQYYWWGYSTVLNSCQTENVIKDARIVGDTGNVSGGGLGILGYFFPVFLLPAAISFLTGGYFNMFANSLENKNKGRGVIVDMTWVGVYDITSQ